MASIVVSGDTSGAVTITAPAIAGTTTLTLPTTSGTLVVTGGAQTIEFADGTVSAPSITNSGDTNTGIYFPAADTIAFTEGGVESMRIDSSGNVGIGVTPNAWGSSWKSLSINTVGALAATTGVTRLYHNAFNNDSANVYRTTAAASMYSQDAGTHQWFYAGSGTAGANISFTEAMRIDSSGNVGIGTSSALSKLDVRAASAVIANYQTIQAFSTDSAGIDLGAGLSLGGYYSGTSAIAVFGSVVGRKENSTAGNFSGYLAFGTNNNSTGTVERMRIDSSGNVAIGTNSPNSYPNYTTITLNGTNGGEIDFEKAGTVNGSLFNPSGTSDFALTAANGSGNLILMAGGYIERMRITSGGNVIVGKTSTSFSTNGTVLYANGAVDMVRSAATILFVNRETDDGELVWFGQAGVQEGSISVSGTTVSYNGGHLSRWSQLPNNQKDDTILKGTVMSNLDNMCVWVKDGEELPNEQLNKIKVSDVEGDINVAGVFVNWTFDEECQSEDMNVAMTGDMIIRIAQGVVVQKGDLLMSAGDGTAKPQGDDIVRSKTVAKVTSNHVTCTYADGSYCVPCVLMAC